MEKIAAYETEAKEIWNAYNDNEFVADEDFKGKPIVFSGKCASVAKDALGKVYVKINIDKHGLHGLQIYLDKNDKFLRQLKRGQDVVFRAYPRSFVMKNVLLDGEVIMINKPKK